MFKEIIVCDDRSMFINFDHVVSVELLPTGVTQIQLSTGTSVLTRSTVAEVMEGVPCIEETRKNMTLSV